MKQSNLADNISHGIKVNSDYGKYFCNGSNYIKCDHDTLIDSLISFYGGDIEAAFKSFSYYHPMMVYEFMNLIILKNKKYE